ncbi:MAG TPA: DUF2779 domain-containing protein [Gemmatimonadaceae bacterium]|nr:DUF2779 domain-containing protein [Gemmatimonadaceae bacterium]
MRTEGVNGRLTKTRYASGSQCPKRLWLETHEPDAPELIGQQIPTVLLEQGRRCGELARARWPDGTLVGDGRTAAFDLERAAAETRALLESGTRVLFEATFLTDDAVAIVDVLERLPDGWRLIEVKQSNECHEEYVTEVAFQLHVLERCGVPVREAAVMHLDRECRFPDLDSLFVIQNVTETARAFAAELEPSIRSMVEMLAQPMPDTPVDVACVSPAPCAFKPRCWSGFPDHHVSTLYMLKKKEAFAHHHAGRMRVVDVELPAPKKKPSATAKIQWRQQESLQRAERIVEREALAAALGTITYPLAMLDFETVQLAIPVWAGCSPHAQVPVQFSCHVISEPGAEPTHHAWIARGADDPRPRIVEHLLVACRGAATVMAYFSSFEKACLERLAAWVPARERELLEIRDRIVDLLPIVREHVYDPAFGGSFSIKRVLPALVPHMSYAGLTISKGDVAAAELYRVMFERMEESEREYVSDALLEYCRMDTAAMVELHRALEVLAKQP